MHSQKVRVLSLNLILVMLLTLVPVQAVDGTDTGTDKEKTYTVTLNGNGGSLGNENEVKISYSTGDTLDMGKYPFTRDGYLLVGWSEDENGNGDGWFADCNLTLGCAGDKTFYAVWFKIPEGKNYAIFNTSGHGTIAGAVSNSNGFYCVELTEDFRMPTLQKNSGATVDLWLWSSNNDLYYEGEAFTPKNGMWFNLIPVWGGNGSHEIIFDGNGGTGTIYSNGTAYTVNRISSSYRDGDTVGGHAFVYPGYTLTGFSTEQDGKGGTFYPIGSAFTITEDMAPVQILYAQWTKEYHLEDNVSLVIGGEDKSDLLDSTTECTGTGWTYQVVDGVSVLHLTKDYNGGSIICKRDNVNIIFDDAVSMKRIEVSGALTLTANDDYAKVYESDDTAIRADSVTLAAAAGNYKIVSEKNAAIQAESLYLNSDDVRIEGSPAVLDGTEITCGEKARLQTNRNSEGAISALYTYPKSVTLYGNGGNYNGEETITVDYPDKGSLDLSQITFEKENYIFRGWAVDKEGTKLATDATGHLKGTYKALYAVWAEAPDYEQYVLFKTNGYGTIEGADELASGLYCVQLTADFKMPTLQKDSTTVQADLWLWQNNSLICYEDEAYTPDSGMEFHIVPVIKKDGYHQLIFDGNGGTGGWCYINGTAYAIDKYGPDVYRDDDTAGGHIFKRPSYILTGFNTEKDGTGKAYPIDNFKITSDMAPVQRLYAQWSPLRQLKNGARFIVDGDDMSALVDLDGSSYGSGWNVIFQEGKTSLDARTCQVTISDRDGYQGGGIAYDGDLMVLFRNDATVGQVEAAGSLRLDHTSTDEAAIRVRTKGMPALRATQVRLGSSNAYGTYDIEAEGAVGVDAAYLILDSIGVTIKGDPAVREGAVIECINGVDYKITDGGKTLTTYAVEQTLTLVGNGGTLNGQETETVTFSSAKPLDLSEHTFQKDGYVLAAWASDPNEQNYEADANETLKRCGYNTLYAVWLKVPENSGYIILRPLQDGCAGAYDTKMGYSSIAMSADGTVTLPEQNNHKSGIAVWRKSVTREPYFAGETVKVPSGTRFDCALYYNASKILIFDGNGGTMQNMVNGVQRTVIRRMVTTAAGKTYHSESQFVMDGYTMTGYNTKADGTGKSYPYDEFLVTKDMEDQTILYAQWEKSDPSEEDITIDGSSYTAKADHGGYNWNYFYDAENEHGYLTLNNYQGGDITSDIDLSIRSNGQSVVNGSISSKKGLYIGGSSNTSNTSSLTVTAKDGSALSAAETIRLLPTYKVTVTSESAPAIKASEFYIGMNLNGSVEATGTPTALSYDTLRKDDGDQSYQVYGGADKANAALITDESYTDKSYIFIEMRDRVLTLHGNGGVTTDNEDTFTATSKANTFDLGAYTDTFTNGDKRLLGWAETADSKTVKYAASSGVTVQFGYLTEFAKDLYAVWENGSQRGVVLKNYGYFDGDRYTYSEQYTALVESGTYTLPESSRAGYIFKGWLGSNDKIYAAGDTIELPTALSFTAQYEVGKLTVGGVAYTANQAHGSDALGWRYYPDGYINYDGRALLYLSGNYSGKPITLDGNLYLSLNTKNNDLTGEEGSPLVSVTGDMHLALSGGDGATLIGGKNAPAIKVGGTLHLSDPITLIGGEGAPAMVVGALDAGYAFLAGESEKTAERAGTYHDEHYFRMDLGSPATFQPGDLVPQMPDTDTRRFIGWSTSVKEKDGTQTVVWYLPGEKITGSEKMLSAHYLPNDAGIIFLDGNGAVTAHGARYSDAVVILPNQESWRYMNADELKTVFHHDGFEMTGFVGPDPDTGKNKLYTLNDLDNLSVVFDDGQLHAGKTTIYTAQWNRIGKKTEDSSAYYTKADDGTVKIESVDQTALEKQLETDSTAQIDVSKLEAEKVTLPVSAVNDVLDLEAEALSIKTADAAVSLDKIAMQSVVETAKGADIQLHVSTGDKLNEGQTEIIGDTEQSMVLDVSLTTDGKEIHEFDGKVTVSVPFDWTKQGVLQAWYLADDGKTKEQVEVAYRDGNAVLMLEHFSTYAIVVVTAADAKPPVIDKDSVTLSRTTAKAGDTVEVTVKVTDNVAVSRVAIDFWNNDTGDQLHLWMSRVGDSDIFSAQFKVTENTPAGMWRVFEISAYDTTENYSSIYFSHNENNFFVQSEVPPITVSANNISIDKETATVGDTVTISIKFDNDRVKRVSFDLSNRDSGRQDHFLDMTYDKETQSYIYRFEIDDTVPSGYWEIGFINVHDAYGYGGAEYIGSSVDGFTVTGTSADAKAPVVDNSTLTVSKSEIEGDESSVISVKITDDVKIGSVSFWISNAETGKLLSRYMVYNEGTDRYEYTFTADETIPSGHWALNSIFARDAAGNLNLQNYRWECYILVKGENEHVWRTDKAVEATCTRTGLTEGESCEICGKVKTPQQVVEMKPHSFTDRRSYQLASKATCTEAAKYYVQCDNCFTVSDTLTVSYGNALGHKFSSSEPYCLNGCGTKNPDYKSHHTPSGKPSVKPATDEPETAKNPFTDVTASDYFYDAVVWAANQGIALGDSATTFRPNGTCARAEIVTFLWRAAGSPEPAGTSTSFLDVPENAYYYKAVLWAAENGIVKGTTETEFGANAACTRAQVVTFLYRYAGTNATAKDNPFTDVNMDAYYYDAVAWTAAEGITAGTSAATFSPNDSCTRGQIVTFLYRTYNR